MDIDSPLEPPHWIEEIGRALAISPQFILYGNIHDVFLFPEGRGVVPLGLVDSLWERLHPRGYRYLLVFNSTGGLRVIPSTAGAQVVNELGLGALAEVNPNIAETLANGEPSVTAAHLPRIAEAVQRSRLRGGLVIENASRLQRVPGQPDEDEQRLFASFERILHSATAQGADDGSSLFNPVFWVVDTIRDLPDWLVIVQDRSRAIALPLPDEQARGRFARLMAPLIERDGTPEQLSSGAQVFTRLSHGLSLSEMRASTLIARDQEIRLSDVGDAIRSYKVGRPRDPWATPELRATLRNGETQIGADVKGQRQAIRKVLDILKRSAMGLSGAQANSSQGRPRGVLFFAGPTGVGKTELAKAIGKLVFGSNDSVVRFDMSEFSAEQSEARLIGAPPGFVGFDQGGELVNAVRARPFSVLLFDEIEKAHKLILDKFLQVLEDGRLTDGRGDTIYFSEAIIIFTSNLGVSSKDRHGDIEYHVRPGEQTYPELSERIKAGINTYFMDELRRPELLNRVGEDNIIVFDFIDEQVAGEILQKNLDTITINIRKNLGRELVIAPQVLDTIRAEAVRDRYRNFGGRGIGSAVETCFINPLARELCDMPRLPESRIEVVELTRDVIDQEDVWSARLQ